MRYLSARELHAWLADSARPQPVLLDVREPWEFEICHIPESVLIPMNTIPDNLSSLDKSLPIVCICHHGVRSQQVGHFLERQGFDGVINLDGGIHAWACEVDSAMPTY